MIGISLMSIGVIIVVIVLFIYSSSRSSTKFKSGEQELENIIEMAVADGILTNNEKSQIKQYSEKNGLDYNKIIKSVDEKISKSSIKSETALIDFDKKNGDDFEKFIVQNSTRNSLKLKNGQEINMYKVFTLKQHNNQIF